MKVIKVKRRIIENVIVKHILLQCHIFTFNQRSWNTYGTSTLSD